MKCAVMAAAVALAVLASCGRPGDKSQTSPSASPRPVSEPGASGGEDQAATRAERRCVEKTMKSLELAKAGGSELLVFGAGVGRECHLTGKKLANAFET